MMPASWRQKGNEMENSFEEKMKRLEEIVSLLEKEDTELDDSISLYEEGLKLSKELKDTLQSFEQRINAINEENKDA